jgi:hypothetical protein
MSQYIDDPISGRQPSGRQPGSLGESEKWWAERQEALERAGYLLRTRYRPGWHPSWTGTGKFYLNFEDGQRVIVSLNTLSLPACAYDIRCAWEWTQLAFLTGGK